MLRKLTSPFREFGLLSGFLYAADRVLSKLSPSLGLKVYDFMVQPISNKPLLPDSLAKKLEFREIARGDPELQRMPPPPEIIESRFAQNATCLATCLNGKMIGYIWFCFGTYDEDEARCRYVLHEPAQAVFDFDLYVFPEYRMGVGFLGTWHGANRYLYERGVRHTYSRLTRFNVASRRSHEHLGWKRIGSAVVVIVGRAEILLSTLAPYVSVSLQRRARLYLRPDILSAERKGKTV
jgi:hypothetical protein